MKRSKRSMLDLANQSLRSFSRGWSFETVLADPPWRFQNRTGKMAPEHRRLARYETMTLGEIAGLPVPEDLSGTAHIYLWGPNAFLAEGVSVLEGWGFTYQTKLVLYEVRQECGP